MIVILLINATNNREDITALYNIVMGWKNKHEIRSPILLKPRIYCISASLSDYDLIRNKAWHTPKSNTVN